MRKRAPCWCVLLLPACIFAQAGCYYQVVDPKSGAVYFTPKWVAADGYHGPLTFTDHTGKTVSLRASRVSRIARDDYLDATGLSKKDQSDSADDGEVGGPPDSPAQPDTQPHAAPTP